MNDCKKVHDLAIISGVSLIVREEKPQNIEDSSLVCLGYQLLLPTTNRLMGDNKEFEDSTIF